MAKAYIPDSQVEEEIARLTKSPYVRMARAEQQIKYRRRKYLSQLQSMEKRGMELERQGFPWMDLKMIWRILQNDQYQNYAPGA